MTHRENFDRNVWTKRKPKPTERLLITACWIQGEWDFDLFLNNKNGFENP